MSKFIQGRTKKQNKIEFTFERCLSALVIVTTLLLANGCSGSSESQKQSVQDKVSDEIVEINTGLAIPDNRAVNEYQLLFFGNSHVSFLPEIIKTLIETTMPNKTVVVERAPGAGYLVDRINDQSSIELLTENSWTHIILQAQKYSQSGGHQYPTDAAERWIAMAKEQNVTPILFPEHPQKGDTQEGQYVHNIHTEIASRQASCVSPVGLAWDRAISLNPSLDYYHPDGNHAALIGRLLTAYVLYEVITGQSADLIPDIEALDVDNEIQSFLRQVASEVVLSHTPCDFSN